MKRHKADAVLMGMGTDSVLILFPCTRAARVWLEQHCPDAMQWGGGIAIENRYVAPILQGMAQDGLIVTGEA